MCGPCWRIEIAIRPTSRSGCFFTAMFIPVRTERIAWRGVRPAKVWITGE
jgi:hypothetical protein